MEVSLVESGIPSLVSVPADHGLPMIERALAVGQRGFLALGESRYERVARECRAAVPA